LIPSQQRIDVVSDLVHDVPGVPRGAGKEMMERLGIAAWDHLGDPLHITTGCLQQAAQVLLSLSHHIASL
jgi:hypothetical protein